MNPVRVLFVDDEPRILDGLRRSLRGKRRDWEMSFAAGGEAALELLTEHPQDVVVSDMRMPGMNGAELLTHVSQRYPEVARVVLSGHTEPEAAIKVAIVGHRFLTKPANLDQVISVVTELTPLPGAPAARARRIAGAAHTLPSPAAHVGPLTALLFGPDAELSGAAWAAAHNVGLAAKLLQLSRSPFFVSRARSGSMDSLVNAVGLPTLQALVDTGQLLWSAPRWGAGPQACLERTVRHAVASADIVGLIASPGNRAHARAAALLQDVGRFVCLAASEFEAESAGRICGAAPHRDVGVELLRLWGVPSPIIAAVARRDATHQPSSTGLGVAAAVRTAHLLIQQTEAHDPADGTHDEELDRLLAHPQLRAPTAGWVQAAKRAADRAGQWPASMTSDTPHTSVGPSATATPWATPSAAPRPTPILTPTPIPTPTSTPSAKPAPHTPEERTRDGAHSGS